MTALLAVAAFTGMDRAELDRIEAACRIIEPRDGSQIFAAGDEADAVYAVVGGAGRVRIGAPVAPDIRHVPRFDVRKPGGAARPAGAVPGRSR